ncbi:NHLP leader peptide family natural product precursor [Paenibacillus sp. 19GGS1-52]|uniref:NHLP leader peptide family RiPP precursor n=1 Tax=Paenibacillus sp. 19GGS1-52 TaxID=2758563 RepID=UPI001EFAA416|nr:NHLP leader peptide family RiPP precursor [Paenibacillus sp. 19GGS1-52]ULO09865.1 NHLP leader peptide family natural product precursor [Paenibacillus sp. 19GGS1-52]
MSNEDVVANAIEAVTSKAVTDNEFRALCLSNPREAVKQATGLELPENFKLQVVENAGAHYTLVLPDAVSGEELNESELEQVAGGATSTTFMFLIAPECFHPTNDGDKPF